VSLTNGQKAFVEEYFEDFNATRAAERAGYGGDDNVLAAQGSRLLKNVKVAEKIKQRFAEKAMSADEALSRVADIARGNLGRYLDISNTDKIGLDYDKLTEEGQLHLIKSVSTNKDGELGRVEFYSALQALELVLKAAGVFDDGVTINLPPFDPKAWKKQADERQNNVEDLFDPYEGGEEGEDPHADPEP
jgi:hypothetical protein